MSKLVEGEAPKKAVNLRISQDLAEEAKALGINLSQTFERHLAELVREARRRQWLEANRDALESYNEHIARRGVFSDGLRRF
ncbi:MAG: type II toxin-antitoxin system CcdA family antitoxin [Kiloniellales bacterium]